jgi:hypothetical protein
MKTTKHDTQGSCRLALEWMQDGLMGRPRVSKSVGVHLTAVQTGRSHLTGPVCVKRNS